MTDDQVKIAAGQETPQLEDGEDLAAKALQASQTPSLAAQTAAEVEASDDLAETLGYLQNIIERNAQQLGLLKEELKQKRESLKSVFENDAVLEEAEELAKVETAKVRERKQMIKNSPQATQLKTNIGEINEQVKEIEEALSNHLLNYYTMTNSTSFDTSDGDQWEFNIKARVKTRKQSQD